jgi:hypothetical protein
MELGRPAEARTHFEETLRRTPGRPKAIAGIARAAQAMGDTATATAQYTRLLDMWKRADSGSARAANSPAVPAVSEPIGAHPRRPISGYGVRAASSAAGAGGLAGSAYHSAFGTTFGCSGSPS